MSQRQKRNTGLTDEDRRLWDRVRRDVKPLPGMVSSEVASDALMPAQEPANIKSSNEIERQANAERLHSTSSSPFKAAPYYPPLSTPASKSASELKALDNKTLRQLKKGRLSIDAQIDLHGMTQMHAHAALKSFISDSAARGHRIVLAITGKGRQSAGVLRQQVPHWLGESGFRDFVAGFRAAHLTHGGEGALYIRLRRRREQ